MFDESLFSRFVRLGVPTIELDAQGRSRPSICSLYNWRYRALGNLPHVLNHPDYQAGLPIKNPSIKTHLKKPLKMFFFGVF
jgi:intron-binding protein aquarius